jgi:hypothetical protein
MPEQLPDLHLTHGQLLWAIRYGRDPDRQLKDQVRYLRALGIPAAAKEQAKGPGTRITYDFFDLIEVGVAITALNFRLRPKDISAVLVGKRDEMRKVYVAAWKELPEQALTAEWVKSRGQRIAIPDVEYRLRLHERHSEQWGEMDWVGPEETTPDLPIFHPIERFADGLRRPVLPLKQLMIQWVAWALEAPPTKPGPAKLKE